MKNLILMAVVAIAACGASAQEIRTAKLARYQAPSDKLFDVALSVAQETYKAGQIDVEGRRFATAPQVYNPEGGRQSPGKDGFITCAGHGTCDRSVILALVVEVLQAEEGRTAVLVRPRTFQMLEGSPKPRALAPDDPNLPPWVLGRVDALALAIYERAKKMGIQISQGASELEGAGGDFGGGGEPPAPPPPQ